MRLTQKDKHFYREEKKTDQYSVTFAERGVVTDEVSWLPVCWVPNSPPLHNISTK